MQEMIVSSEGVVVASDETPEFSWCAVFAGALVGSAVIFFLLFLGAGLGLSLATVPETTPDVAASGLTLGGIYFFAAQAFGMCVGGYLAGRLMGPRLESEAEELFHSSTHGLVTWALAVVATATMVAISGLVLSSSGLTAAAIYGAPNTESQRSSTLSEGVTGYWVDTLFRPSPAAALPPAPAPAVAGEILAAPIGTVPDRAAEADARAEVSRILTVGLANGGQLSEADRNRAAMLVAQFTGADAAQATARVEDVQNRIRQQEVSAAEIARQVVRNISLLLAAALIFGALVASASAVLGRSVDDEARLAKP